jgi:hypothetical protein
MQFIEYESDKVGIHNPTGLVVVSDVDMRNIIHYLWNNKADMVREIVCENCPEILDNNNYGNNKVENGK